MEYFIVRFGEEYARKNCQYGIVDGKNVIDEYAVKDEKPLPIEMLKNVELEFDENPVRETADFQMAYLSWRLISESFFKLLSKFIASEEINFFPFRIKHGKSYLLYYLMHFKEKIDIINKEKSSFIENELWIPIFDINKAPFPRVFNFKGSIGVSFCISEEVKIEMEKMGTTGCNVERLFCK